MVCWKPGKEESSLWAVMNNVSIRCGTVGTFSGRRVRSVRVCVSCVYNVAVETMDGPDLVLGLVGIRSDEALGPSKMRNCECV